MRGRLPWRGVCLAVLCVSPFLLSGCELYDWLVREIGTALSPVASYQVSVIDCKTIPTPGSLLKLDSKLAARLSASIREGVNELRTLSRFQNVHLADKIPATAFPGFHDEFLGKPGTQEQRLKMLQGYCDKYQTNLLLWGAAMGDDYEISFIGYLYRRDLNAVSETAPLKMTEKMSARVQEKLVSEATTGLLKKSLEGDSKDFGTAVTDTLRDNKEAVLAIVTTVLFKALSESMQEGY